MMRQPTVTGRGIPRNELGKAATLADAAYDNLVALTTALDVYSRRTGFVPTADQADHLRRNMDHARDNLAALEAELAVQLGEAKGGQP